MRQRVLPRLFEEPLVQLLELLVLGGQTPVQPRHPVSRGQAHLQLVAVERFGEIVVGAGGEACEQVSLAPEGRQEDKVGVVVALVFPYEAAQRGAVDARHHPVAYYEVDPGRVPVELQGSLPVLGVQAFVTELLD